MALMPRLMPRLLLYWGLLLLTPSAWAGLSGCDDLSGMAVNPAVDFEAEIQPIFDQHCTTCHGPPDPIAFMDLTLGYQQLVSVPSFQLDVFDRVMPGQAAQSYLMFKINCGSQFSGERMPFNAAPLNLPQQALIRDWINQIIIFSDGFE